MCGLAAVLLYPQPRSVETWAAITGAFTQNLLFNEKRGQAATGIAVQHTDGQVSVRKTALAAAEFVQTPGYQSLLAQITSATTLLLGHTRHPTQGTPANNHNNHPLQSGAIFGIHNGHIHNDAALFAKFRLPRTAQVDSEIIFRLLAHHAPAPLNAQLLPHLQPSLSQMEGKFTFLAADQRAPGHLLALKHHNPLSVYFHPEWNALIFSSSYLFLRKQFGRRVIHQSLPNNRLLLFEATQLPRCQHRPFKTQPLYCAT